MSEPRTHELRTDPWAAADEILGRPGRMLSGSKQAPAELRVVWNGNVLTKTHGKVWFGDISLEKSGVALKELARRLGEPVYVLREHDARFDTEKNPRWDEAVEVFDA